MILDGSGIRQSQKTVPIAIVIGCFPYEHQELMTFLQFAQIAKT